MHRVVILIATVSLIAIGCSRQGQQTSETKTTVSAKSAASVKKSIRWTVEQPGKIEAFEMTPLIAKVPGFVKKVHVDIDDPIEGPSADNSKPGTLLAEIAMPEVEQEVKQREAQAKAAEAEIELARKNLAAVFAMMGTATANVAEARAREKGALSSFERWKSESVRVQELVTRKVLDKQTGEETQNQLTTAEGALEEAKAHSASVVASLVEAEARKEKAEAEVKSAIAKHAAAIAEAKRAAALLDYSQIRAPYSGVVTARYVHTGQYLQPNSKSEMLFSVARIDKVRVVVETPESDAARIRKGMKAKVRIPSMRISDFEGEIARTSWALNSEAKTLRVEIDLPNPDRKIRPGLYATALIPVDQIDAFTIPVSAVSYLDDNSYAYLLIDGKAARYQLQLGRVVEDSIEVIRKKRVGPKDPWQAWDGRERVLFAAQGPIADGVEVEIRQ